MNRLTAVEQSIYAEVQLSELFTVFATAFYSQPEAQAFWERLARAEAYHVLLLEFEKWRIVREDLDNAVVQYDDASLLRQMKKFDEIRSAVVLPPDLKKTLEFALQAEGMALTFHGDRIFIDDFGVSDQVVQLIAANEDVHQEIITKLAGETDPIAAIKGMDISVLDPPPLE